MPQAANGPRIIPAVARTRFRGAARSRSYTASTPFDCELLTLGSSLQSVRFSLNRKLVIPPGYMFADEPMYALLPDPISQVSAGNPLFATCETSGQICRFALDENGSLPRVSLDLEISLWQKKPVRIVLFRKHFHYQSPPLSRHQTPLYFPKPYQNPFPCFHEIRERAQRHHPRQLASSRRLT